MADIPQEQPLWVTRLMLQLVTPIQESTKRIEQSVEILKTEVAGVKGEVVGVKKEVKSQGDRISKLEEE